LDVSAITSQFELSGRGGMTGGQQRDSANSTLFGDMALQFRDAPTLSYTPRDPTELTRAMVAPVGITALGLMANTGWNSEDVLRLIVAEVNGVQNAPGATDIVPLRVPPWTPFPELAQLVGELRRERLLVLESTKETAQVSPPIGADRVDGSDLVEAAANDLEYRQAGQPDALILTRNTASYRLAFHPDALGRPDVEALWRMLNLVPGRLEYAIKRESVPGGVDLLPLPQALDEVHLRTRTLLEMVTFLSKGVEVPEDHLCRGLVAQTVGPDGVVFDWTSVTSGMFRVCAQKHRPKAAAVAIEHRGYWYYIPESDKRTKATLAMLQGLFNLQLSEPKKSGPLLTLPVGF
jgi:hypothetical protein